ncbi:unnamed protein product [Nippostrongylus brasiliensis]|uniref:C3H1-type domain-containing protein n=1 Tax=Nippostrongylus brasiliensis TaxID=27835 RepID=A0A0N4YFB4_NIPBR|nr:unnamed protein product [Nippostrongylus brasiliensis]
MALNLLSSYGSDVDSDDSETVGSVRDEGSDGPPLETPIEDKPQKESSFFFGGDDDSSDDGAAGPSNEDQTIASKSAVRRLPSAGSVLKGKHVDSSVFSSEREREDLAHAITLSQHVPLTEKVEVKKKPLCRAFARGECRRGAKCRFAHPIVAVAPKDAVTIDGAPRMYCANDIDDIFSKKPKIA